MARVLFVCLHNAGRSQMSQALFARAAAAAGAGHEASSAGTTPGQRVHPEVVEVMRQLGMDVSDRVPQRLTDELAAWADVGVQAPVQGYAFPIDPRPVHLAW